MDSSLVDHVNVINVAEVRRMCVFVCNKKAIQFKVTSKPMKLCTINVECLANMQTIAHHFISPNNDFTGFVYELRGQPSYFPRINFLLMFQN